VSTNIMGVDVSHLDVAAFLNTGRLAFTGLSLLWLLLSLRVRRPG
jgi:hypothetical protein